MFDRNDKVKNAITALDANITILAKREISLPLWFCLSFLRVSITIKITAKRENQRKIFCAEYKNGPLLSKY